VKWSGLVPGLLLLLPVSGCAARPAHTLLPGPVPAQACSGAPEVTHSIFLIGDAGAPKLPKHPEAELPVDPVLRNLRDEVMDRAGALGVDRVTVVYLGDNVYFHGLVPVGDADRERGERVLRAQISAAGPARVVFTAGDHDWDVEGPRGWTRIRAQQGFLSTQGERVSMLPIGGCTGPERVDFGDHLRFVFIDLIGFGHAIDFPDKHAEVCRHETAVEALMALSWEFDHPEGRHMVMALHHPLITTSDVYLSYITGIYRATRPRVPLLFAAGHEHSLQLHRDAIGTYYAVSGAGSASEVDRVGATPSAMYSEAVPGYMRLDTHANGALSLTVTSVRGERREAALSHCLADGPAS
jgi:hypothetical protein